VLFSKDCLQVAGLMVLAISMAAEAIAFPA
jgi:hypothetical protein